MPNCCVTEQPNKCWCLLHFHRQCWWRTQVHMRKWNSPFTRETSKQLTRSVQYPTKLLNCWFSPMLPRHTWVRETANHFARKSRLVTSHKQRGTGWIRQRSILCSAVVVVARAPTWRFGYQKERLLFPRFPWRYVMSKLIISYSRFVRRISS